MGYQKPHTCAGKSDLTVKIRMLICSRRFKISERNIKIMAIAGFTENFGSKASKSIRSESIE